LSKGEVTLQDDPEVFLRVLAEAVDIMERHEIPFACFGSLASVTYGHPAAVGDIDFLIRPQDDELALERLEEADFTSERFDPAWLYKARKDGVLLDLIFRVKGDLLLDQELLEHVQPQEIEGVKVPLVSAEDAVVIEALSNDGQTPQHWYNALGILARTDLDWEYLEQRARYGARRILSLLIYAESTDLRVPTQTLANLFRSIYGE
jgi:predicted nucleotidyltransferase